MSRWLSESARPGRRRPCSACAGGCRKPKTPSTPSATATSRRSSCSAPEGEQIYTLRSADQPYRLMVEQMREGALTLAADGTILYCNQRFAELMALPAGTHHRAARSASSSTRDDLADAADAC